MWKNASELRKIAEKKRKEALHAEAEMFVEDISKQLEVCALNGGFVQNFSFPNEEVYYIAKKILEEKCAVYGYCLTYRLNTLSGTISWWE